MPGPLTGVRVIDLTHVLNGPFCTMLLAHMGAEVLKIEHGKGDRFRHAWMPMDATHDGYEFLVVNANKKAITLNLKPDKGKDIFRELVKKADVVVENFSIGVMDRLGLGYSQLREINPRIIYASSKGFGEDGPYKHMRANASTIMAATGWTNAAWEYAGKDGGKSLGIGDEASGVSMATGILAALYEREKSGRGQKLTVSMQEALLGFMVSSMHTHFEKQAIGGVPKQCADGYMAFHLPDITNELWEDFAKAMGHPEALEDPRFATPETRRANYPAVEQAAQEWVKATPRDRLWEILLETGSSSAPVLRLAEVYDDRHLKARDAFVDIEHPEAGTIKMLRPWVRFSETPTAITHAGPRMGEHNHSVYKDLLGMDAAEVDRLEAEGVL